MNIQNVSDFDVCLYHSGCPDGIGAAWCIWREHKINMKNEVAKPLIIYGVKYNEPYPEDIIRGKKVIIVDFSYDSSSIKKMCEIAEYIFILDHHDIAQRQLEGLYLLNFSYIFDMSRSGVQITWDYCYPNQPRPWFVEVIADRDLWKWTYPDSKELGKALYQFGWYNFEKLEELFTLSVSANTDTTIKLQKTFLKQGTILVNLEKKDISYAVNKSILCEFQGYKARITSCPHLIRSEVGRAICEKGDCVFSITWRYDFEADQWWVSLRGSKTCPVPLNVLCEKFSGGGHQRACGFAIHGSHSKEWINASDEKRSKMAYGNLHNYFIIK